jgi:hypothetical protein
MLLQGTFSVVYNMHSYFMCFQTRSQFRDEPNLIISVNDYKSKQDVECCRWDYMEMATLSTSISLKKSGFGFSKILIP